MQAGQSVKPVFGKAGLGRKPEKAASEKVKFLYFTYLYEDKRHKADQEDQQAMH